VSIKKTPVIRLSEEQAAAGKRMWNLSDEVGRLSGSSVDHESAAPRTWIRWIDGKGFERAVVECEIYIQPRYSDHEEAVGVLHGMCPCCGEGFIVREDNKTMTLDHIEYRKAPEWLRVHYAYDQRERGRPQISDTDKIPIVNSPERWACDYCKEWVVRIIDNVASDDHSGITRITVPQSALVGTRRPEGGGQIDI